MLGPRPRGGSAPRHLRDDGEARAQLVERQRADVDAVNVEAATLRNLGLDKPPQRRDESRLARARPSDNAHLPKKEGGAGRDEEEDAVDVPDPVRPTMPTLDCASIVHVTLRSANGSSGR